MKIRELIKNKKHIKSIGLALTIISSGLLLREIIQYNKLPSKDDPRFELIDFFKYQEDALTNIIVFAILGTIGLIVYVRNRKK